MIKKENMVASSGKYDDNTLIIANSLIAEETQHRASVTKKNIITKDIDEDNRNNRSSYDIHNHHDSCINIHDIISSSYEYHNGYDHSSHSHNYVDSCSNIHDGSSASYDSSGSSFFD